MSRHRSLNDIAIADSHLYRHDREIQNLLRNGYQYTEDGSLVRPYGPPPIVRAERALDIRRARQDSELLRHRLNSGYRPIAGGVDITELGDNLEIGTPSPELGFDPVDIPQLKKSDMLPMLRRYQQVGFDGTYPFVPPSQCSTIYVLGSPGAGKTAFIQRLSNEIPSSSVLIESGVWNFFLQKAYSYVLDNGYIDEHFSLPFIEGFNYWDLDENTDILEELMHATLEDIESAMQMDLVGAQVGINKVYNAYRTAKDHIRSGGKSAFPDRLIYTSGEDTVELISFPGHYPVYNAQMNRSIPQINAPDAVIYLVDPLISNFERHLRNRALENCHLHLNEVLNLEIRGIPTYWVLSKTPELIPADDISLGEPDNALWSEDGLVEALPLRMADLNDKYRGHPHLSPMLDEITSLYQKGELLHFDSYDSTSEEIFEVLGLVLSGIRQAT